MGLLEKMRPADSVIEHLLAELKAIQEEKSWSNEELGREFAQLLVRQPAMMMMDDEYDDEYGDEYGEEFNNRGDYVKVQGAGMGGGSDMRRAGLTLTDKLKLNLKGAPQRGQAGGARRQEAQTPATGPGQRQAMMRRRQASGGASQGRRGPG